MPARTTLWPTATERRRELVIRTAGTLFVERGFAGVTVEDVAEAVGCVRSTVYGVARGCPELLVLAAALALEDAPTLLTPGDLPTDSQTVVRLVGERLVQRHDRTGAVELVIRAAAATGVPSAREFVAGLELFRRAETRFILEVLLRGAADDRLHLLTLLLGVDRYAHLIDRCGWSPERFARRTEAELRHLVRYPLLPWG